MYEGLIFPKELRIPDKSENLNGTDSRRYFKWLMKQIPERINYLQEYLISEENFIISDVYSDNILIEINKWYDSKVDYYYLDKDNINYVMGLTYEQLPLASKISYTTETSYISTDIALYLCEYICKRVKNMYWTICKDGKRNIKYNYPVIKNRDDKSFNLEPMGFINKYNYYLIQGKYVQSFYDKIYEYILIYGRAD